MPEQRQFQERLGRIEELVHRVESLENKEARASALELARLLMDLHGAGIGRMMEIVAASGNGSAHIVEDLSRDELVSSLLLLYGLHPVDVETRVRRALESVRPMLHAHGGDVELLGIAEGVVRVRLQGSCDGCPSSESTLRLAIDEAVFAAAPEVTDILAADGQSPAAGEALVQLSRPRANGDRATARNAGVAAAGGENRG